MLSDQLLDFDDISKTKCRLHGNVCSSVSDLDTAIYTDCSCTRQYRAIVDSIESYYYYPTDDVILATVATFVAASEAHGVLFEVNEDYCDPDDDTRSEDDKRMDHLEYLREDILMYLEQTETAAADAAAAATPGDVEHARYVNVARMAAESVKVAQNALTLVKDAATAKIASRKATDKAIDAAKKAAASSAASNSAATDFAAAVEVASSMEGNLFEHGWNAVKIASRNADDASRIAANTAIATVADYAAYAAAAKNAAVARGAANAADMAANRAFKAAATAKDAAKAAAKDVNLRV
jgi:hypothetical protein